jgi:hypothetical protein
MEISNLKALYKSKEAMIADDIIQDLPARFYTLSGRYKIGQELLLYPEGPRVQVSVIKKSRISEIMDCVEIGEAE